MGAANNVTDRIVQPEKPATQQRTASSSRIPMDSRRRRELIEWAIVLAAASVLIAVSPADH
jgi:hypothetical protein